MVDWSDIPQTAFPPSHTLGETPPAGSDPLAAMHRLGDLLPAVLARHGLGDAEPAPDTAALGESVRRGIVVPAVIPQPECPVS